MQRTSMEGEPGGIVGRFAAWTLSALVTAGIIFLFVSDWQRIQQYGPVILQLRAFLPENGGWAGLLDEVRGVLDAAELAPLFAADTLAEVAFSAPSGPGEAPRLHGIIDRLIVGPDRVLAVDFKTNRIVPERPEDVPEGILRQMGAYELGLREVYPGRRIDTAILWTRAARLMALPPGLGLRAFGRLDAGQGRS